MSTVRQPPREPIDGCPEGDDAVDDAVVGRRGFFQTGAGLALGTVSACAQGATAHGTGPAVADKAPPGPFAIPGPHPGRVVEVRHPGSLAGGSIRRQPVDQMVARGMQELTGAADATEAWRRFFASGEVVGVKVNPVGNSQAGKDRRRVVTSPELIASVVAGLRSAGVAAKDIVLFERYRDEFLACGYDRVADGLGVRWATSSISYDNTQIDLEGYSKGDPHAEERNQREKRNGSPKVQGYDPDVFVSMDFVHPLNSPEDPRSRRSHLCNIVSHQVDKVVHLTVLKDHAVAGVTGALKGMSHGLVNNVARTHAGASLNQCNTFIPAVVSMPQLRRKVVLQLMEALVGIYQGGPWASPYTWEPKALLFATDPVALDRVAWDALDAQRVSMGLPVLSRSGTQADNPTKDGKNLEMTWHRTPQHVSVAGVLGLGAFARDRKEWDGLFARPGVQGRTIQLVEHRRIDLA